MSLRNPYLTGRAYISASTPEISWSTTTTHLFLQHRPLLPSCPNMLQYSPLIPAHHSSSSKCNLQRGIPRPMNVKQPLIRFQPGQAMELRPSACHPSKQLLAGEWTQSAEGPFPNDAGVSNRDLRLSLALTMGGFRLCTTPMQEAAEDGV